MTKTVLYSCPFVPAEWIAAHGLRPSRDTASWNGTAAMPGVFFEVCPYARRFLHHATHAQADAVIFTTVCDQMRRISDLAVKDCPMPVFVMNIPSTWQTPTARQMYLSELERLGRFLVKLGGRSPSDEKLISVMLEFDRARQAISASRTRRSPRDFSRTIARFHRTGEPEGLTIPADSASKGEPASGVPVAIVGGPLPEDDDLFDLIQQGGGRVVLDATESGERTLPAPLDRRRLNLSPLAELVDAYFGSIPDIFRRPNTEFFRWFERMRSERNVRGVIYRYYLWCDKWRAEFSRFRESVNLPAVELDVGDESESTRSRNTTRIEALLEAIR